jgi:NTE family protein
MTHGEGKRLSALVLGGGGVKGEFEVGALRRLVELGFEFDFFTGVSVGALNASVLAQYGSLAEGVAALTELWDEIRKNDHVYTTPLFGSAVSGLLTLISTAGIARDAVYDTSPLRRRIAARVSWRGLAKTNKGWAVGVTSMSDGNYYLVTNDGPLLALSERDNPRRRLKLSIQSGVPGSIPDRLVEFILASASLPALFPPVDIYGHRFVDGGLRDVTPLSSAFDYAKAHGYQSVRVVAISTSPEQLAGSTADQLDSGREILARTIDIMTTEILDNDLEEARLRNLLPGAIQAELYSLRPDNDPQLSGLEFDATERRARLREAGYTVASRELQPPSPAATGELIASSVPH